MPARNAIPIMLAPLLAAVALAAQPTPEKDEPPPPPAATPKGGAAPELTAPADTSAKDLLRAAADALRAAKTITYRGKFYATGALGSLQPAVEGDVRAVRGENGRWVTNVAGTSVDRGGANAEYNATWFNDSAEWLDFDKKMLFERRDRDAHSKWLQIAKNVRLDDLFAPDPFARQLASGQFTLEERQTTGGVECDVVAMTQGASSATTKFYLGVEDHCPRKVERIVGGKTAGGSIVQEFNDARFSADAPTITPAALRVGLPDAWTEDRQAAPAAATPPNVTTGPSASAPDSAKGAEPGGPGAEPGDKSDAPRAPAFITPPAPKPARPSLPAFELARPDGAKVSAADLRGSVAVLDFFGTWCLSAKTWHPLLDTVARKYAARGVKFYAVDIRERRPDAAAKYFTDNPFSFAPLLGGDELARQIGAAVFPATAVISAEGEIVKIIQGSRGDESATELSETIEKLLPGGEPTSDTAKPDAPKPDAPKPDPIKPDAPTKAGGK